MMYTRSLKQESAKFDDKYVRGLMAVTAAHTMTNYDVEESFLYAMWSTDYQRSFTVSLIIAGGMIWYIMMVSRRLDRKLSWIDHPFNRLCWQVLLGVLSPALLVFFLVALYFACFGFNIFQTTYLQEDYIVAVLMIIVFNLYLFGTSLFLWVYSLKDMVRKIQEGPAEVPNLPVHVTVGKSTIIMPQDDISLAYIIRDQVLIEDNRGEVFLASDYTLDKLEMQLSKKDFFRINRQLIARREAVKSFVAVEHGKLRVEVDSNADLSFIISQRKAGLFKEWIAHPADTICID